MKRFVSLAMVCLFLLSLAGKETYDSSQVSLSAQAYVLYCADNNEVLLSSGLDTPMGMASTTKIMTSLLALEHAEKNDKLVSFTEDMQAEGSSMYLKKGDILRLSDLAAGMMTVSGNDAANAAAVAIGGSKEKFALMMNQRAEKIGMKNTNFVSPSGLPDTEHYSTVYDMALLMAEAMNNEEFRELTGKKSVEVEFVSPLGQKVTYSNHNRLLSMYEYCAGGKTGYAKSTGRCLVTCSEKDNLRLIAVTFNDRNDWKDHIALYEYGFSKFSAVVTGRSEDSYTAQVLGSRESILSAGVTETKKLVVQKDSADKYETLVYMSPVVFAPVSEGDVLGCVVCTCEGKVVLRNDIVAKNSASYEKTSGLIRFFRRFFK